MTNFFKKTEINSISDILNIYLFFDLTQELVNVIVQQAGQFLYNHKGIDSTLIEENFNIFFAYENNDSKVIRVSGKNLLSSLWIIGVYPKRPALLVDKLIYDDGDFTYRFYTENKNLSVTKNQAHERKPTDHP